jgi:hypothetical protein
MLKTMIRHAMVSTNRPVVYASGGYDFGSLQPNGVFI